MRIDELFKKIAPWEWVEEDEDEFAAEFDIGGYNYLVTFEPVSVEEIESVLLGSDWKMPAWFKRLEKENPRIASVGFIIREGTSADYRDEPYFKTGTGNEFLVFSTVMDIMKAFNKAHFIDYFNFTVDASREPSRARLYDRMAKTFGKGTFEYKYGPIKSYLVKTK